MWLGGGGNAPSCHPLATGVSYGGKTIPRWRTALILKIDISPYHPKNHPILMKFCTQQQMLNWLNVT